MIYKDKMADTALLLYTILLTAALRSAVGQISFCNEEVATQNGNACECLVADLLYDYSKQDCVDESTLYKFGDCGPSASGAACTCNAGWAPDPDTGLCTEPTKDLCATHSCEVDEVCMDLPGRAYCRCEDGSYRFSAEICNSLDETLNPQWFDCPQGYQDETVSYSCRCAEPYFIDVDGDGRNCEINSADGYEDCSTEVYVCASKDGTEVVKFASRGFDNATGEDIDECATPDKYYCWDHSTCQNLEDGQGYLCQCDSGYTDEFFDTTPVKECVLKKEPYCEGCACEDWCEAVECSDGLVCSATSACSADCTQSLQRVALAASAEVTLYTGSVVVQLPQFDYHMNHITLSLEAIVGTQDVQVLSQENDTFTFQVTTQGGRLAGLTADEVRDLVVGACRPLGGSGLCELPGGVVTANDSIAVQAQPSCTATSCPSDEYYCVDLDNGRYQCRCLVDGTGEYFWNFVEICGDPTETTTTNSGTTTSPATVTTPNPKPSTSTPDYEKQAAELQQELDDAEHSLTVTSAILGTLLAVSLVALAILTFFYLKK